MYVKWICLIYILSIHLKTTMQQFYRNVNENPPEEYIEESGDQGYLDDYMDILSTEYAVPAPRTLEQRNHLRFNPQQCLCSCNQCIPPVKPCCAGVCNYCNSAAGAASGSAGTGNINAPSNVVFLPYPVPLVIPNMFKANSSEDTLLVATVQSEATSKATEASTTTITTPNTPNALRSNIVETSAISGLRNTKELNPSARRKSRPTWIPKYGIVPIPDQLAAKLMSQLTEVRALKSRKL